MKVYGKIKSDLEKNGVDEAGKYVNLVEDFSEILKRIVCTFDALSFRLTLEPIIAIYEKINLETDYYRNMNWIFLSYSCTEFTNLLHGDTNSFPVLFEKLLNSTPNNKFPSYLGIQISTKTIEEVKIKYVNIETSYSKEISKIKTSRDKSFSHVDRNQQFDLPSTAVMITVVNKLNNIFIDLCKALGLMAIKSNEYTLKKNPEKFSKEAVLSKIEFFLSYLLRDRRNKDEITREVLVNLRTKLDDLFA